MALLLFSSCVPPAGHIVRRGSDAGIDSQPIRVLVLHSKSPVVVYSAKRMKLRTLRGSKMLLDTEHRRITLNPEKIHTPLVIESWDSPIEVNRKAYRGTLEIHNVLGSIDVINIVSLGDYLKSVVPSEIPSDWNREALKVQAIASRTYACYHILHSRSKRLFDLDATTSFQVYKGLSSEKQTTSDAVEETSGMVVTYRGDPILAYFHSTCGGRTANDSDVWSGSDHPYLAGIDCPYCAASPHFRWQTQLSLADIRKSLQRNSRFTGTIRSIAFRSHDGRVTSVTVRHSQGTCTMTGNEFRLLVNPDTLKSTSFHSKKSGGGLQLSGKGWGHGVGLCQWGARGMAENGKSYKKILQYYYRDGRIERMRGPIQSSPQPSHL
ncbi:MAG: SpoIID/LytB domain-containing protein [Spirochaetes bacterium]|nr:SpoIID/LytB domain-containing protein [Spirochaetota bacterium]